MISIESRSGGRARVAVEHTKLATFDDIERWKFFWAEWLDALEQS